MVRSDAFDVLALDAAQLVVGEHVGPLLPYGSLGFPRSQERSDFSNSTHCHSSPYTFAAHEALGERDLHRSRRHTQVLIPRNFRGGLGALWPALQDVRDSILLKRISSIHLSRLFCVVHR